MRSTLPESGPDIWEQIAPLLDGAVEKLRQKEHDALVLRFFQDKSFREIGAALDASENAAKKRVNHALEKLRRYFSRRGVVASSALIAGMISANSVKAAPVALAKSATTVALAQGATASGAILTLIKETLKIMAWSKAKTAIVVGLAALLVAGTTATLLVKHQHRIQFQTNFPRSSWVNAGYASPEFALETFFWAQSQGDGKVYLASMTSDFQKRLERKFGNELKEQAVSLNEFLAQKSKEDVRPVTGFNIWGRQVVSNEAILRVWISGKEKDVTFKMRKVGTEWKLEDQFFPDY